MPDRLAAAVDAGYDGTVAIRETACVIAALDLAGEPSMRLGAQSSRYVSLMSPRTPRSSFSPPEVLS